MKQQRPKSAHPYSHGTLTKYFQPEYIAKQNKGILAVIHPIPIKLAKAPQEQQIQFKVQAIKLNLKPTYQQKKLQKKPVPDQIKKPFLYVKNIVPKRNHEKVSYKHPDVWNTNTNVQTTRKPKYLHKQRQLNQKDYKKQSLFEIQQKKRIVAFNLFQKLFQICDIPSMKQYFQIWAKDKKINLAKNQYLIDESSFITFIKEITSDKIKYQLIQDFFNQFKKQGVQNKPILENNQKKQGFKIQMKSFSYNFQTYKKSKTQIHDILSQKAADQRYINLKTYIQHWNENYPKIKQTMKDIKQLENNHRDNFKNVKQSYKNPYQDQIKILNKQLKEPMIKYDRARRQGIQKKIQDYLKKHQTKLQQIQRQYTILCQLYQQMILPNHNLFFKKKTIMKLLTPTFYQNNIITKQLLVNYLGRFQNYYQIYLNTISSICMDFTNNKRKLNQKLFSLSQLANYLYKNKTDKTELQYMKKLVKQIKRQYCLKNTKYVDNFDQFPGDQQIQLDVMNKCFQIQCTKVLFKNQVWTQLLQNIIIPQKTYENKYHSTKINMNISLESLKKILSQIDSSMSIELNKSQEISKLVQSITYQDFGTYSEILQRINLNQINQNQDEKLLQHPPRQLINKLGNSLLSMNDQYESQQKKVKFADVVLNKMDKFKEQQQEKNSNILKVLPGQSNIYETIVKQKQQSQKLQKQRDYQFNRIAKSLAKSVINKSNLGFQQSILHNNQNQLNPYQKQQPININMKTLTKSVFLVEPINVNALDIRFHQSSLMKLQQQKKKITYSKSLIKSSIKTHSKIKQLDNKIQTEIVGKSILLSNLPKIQQLPNQDPLRVSRFLLNTLDNIDKQNKQKIQPRKIQKNIKDGVNSNYYKQLVDLQKKPTVFDCEGNSKYSLLLPVQYYTNIIVGPNQQKQKWFLKSHHVESLTQNPLSKKDNITKSQYKSGLQKLPAKKRPDQYIIQQNIARKDLLIYELQNRLQKLKKQLNHTTKGSRIKQGTKVPSDIVQKYFSNLSKEKQHKQLQIVAFQSLLYDLRKKQRDILVDYRQEQLSQKGFPKQKWWQKKDKTFVEDYVRHRAIQNQLDKPQQNRPHLTYIQKLQNKQLY